MCVCVCGTFEEVEKARQEMGEGIRMETRPASDLDILQATNLILALAEPIDKRQKLTETSLSTHLRTWFWFY